MASRYITLALSLVALGHATPFQRLEKRQASCDGADSTLSSCFTSFFGTGATALCSVFGAPVTTSITTTYGLSSMSKEAC
jgi:hypothetical protein